MRIAMILVIGGVAALLAPAASTSAHPGGLNSEGCHNNRRTGDYHCHRGARANNQPQRGRSGVFVNCAAARAAGAAPVRRGESGYGRHLDRDGDGIGCE